METSHYIYDVYLRKLKTSWSLWQKMLLKFWSFFILSKMSKYHLHTLSFGGGGITGKNLVSDLQVSTSGIFVLKTVHEWIRVQGGDPSLEVWIAATDFARSIFKCLFIKSQWTPLYSFTKCIFSGFPILYSS